LDRGSTPLGSIWSIIEDTMKGVFFMFSEYDLDYTWRFKKMSILLDPVLSYVELKIAVKKA